MGITDEILIQNCAKRLARNVKVNESLPWPPTISQLEEREEVNPLLIEFLSCLQTPKISSPDRDPLVLSLASVLTSFITKKRTKILINNSVTLHSITRSKELVEIFYKQGFGISYADGERPHPLEQKVPSFNGFHASFSKSPVVSRTSYHKSYDKPPSKSVLNANLCEVMEAVKLKNMPFIETCLFIHYLLNCALKMKKNSVRFYHGLVSFILK